MARQETVHHPSIRRYKTVIVILLSDPPQVKVEGGAFVPYKMEVTDFGDRAKVELIGQRSHGRYQPWPSTKMYRLYGYVGNLIYDFAPAWVIDIIREAGYKGDIVSEG